MHDDKRDASIVFQQVDLTKRTSHRICSNTFIVQRIERKHVLDSSNKFDVKYCESRRFHFRRSFWLVSIPLQRQLPARTNQIPYTNRANCINSLASTQRCLVSANLEGLFLVCRAKIHRQRFQYNSKSLLSKCKQIKTKISGFFSVISQILFVLGCNL